MTIETTMHGCVDRAHISLYVVSPNVAHSILSTNKGYVLSAFHYETRMNMANKSKFIATKV